MKTNTEIEVRYAETDQMGIVHHSVYPVWFEMGRSEFSRGMGIPYQQMEKIGLLLPVRELSVTYMSPVRYGDVVTVETQAMKLTPARVVFGYRVMLEGSLAAAGETTHAWVGRDLRPLNLKKTFPDIYEAVLKAVEG